MMRTNAASNVPARLFFIQYGFRHGPPLDSLYHFTPKKKIYRKERTKKPSKKEGVGLTQRQTRKIFDIHIRGVIDFGMAKSIHLVEFVDEKLRAGHLNDLIFGSGFH
jgi:hypothetical protein